MRNRNRNLTRAAIIAALYTVLTHLQNILIPNSASFAVQCRVSEALCVLALFTPAAIPGLSVGLPALPPRHCFGQYCDD